MPKTKTLCNEQTSLIMALNFLGKIRRQTHQYFLEKELTGHGVKHQSVNFENAKTIGILFEAGKLEDRTTVLSFAKKLKAQGKKVKLMAFLKSQPKNQNFVFEHFNKKDLDWTWRPKNDRIDSFIKKPFDILINLSTSKHPALDYIAAFSHAKFRVGPFTEKTYCYELMLETGENKDLNSYITQITFFLTKMKTTTHEPAI